MKSSSKPGRGFPITITAIAILIYGMTADAQAQSASFGISGTLCQGNARGNIENAETGVEYSLWRDGISAGATGLWAVGMYWPISLPGEYIARRDDGSIVGSVTLEPPPPASVSLSLSPSATSFCDGESVTFTASGGTAYYWTIGGNNIIDQGGGPTYTMENASPGVYSVTASAIGSYCDTNYAVSATQTITVKARVTAVPTFTGTVMKCPSGGTDDYVVSVANADTYGNWSFTPPEAAASFSGGGQTGHVTWNSAFRGNATISATAYGCGGSSMSGSQVIFIKTPGELTINGSPGTVCSGMPVTLTASGGGAYQWTNSAGGTFAANPYSFSPTQNVTATVTGFEPICNFSRSKSTTISVDATSVGGTVLSSVSHLANNQLHSAVYETSTVSGITGAVQRWEYTLSPNTTWTNLGQAGQTTTSAGSLITAYGQELQLRTVVTNGVCPPVNSSTVVYSWGIEGSRNYVRSLSPQISITASTSVLGNAEDYNKVTAGTQYLDGLGRPLQQVGHYSSPSAKDIVTHHEYDARGLELISFLPYSASGSAGYFKQVAKTDQLAFYQSPPAGVSGDSAPYSKTVVEPSPLHRVLEQGATGTAWQPVVNSTAGHTIKKQYKLNGPGDVYFFTQDPSSGLMSLPQNGTRFYAASQLQASVTIDEHGNEIIEYTDKLGHTVCKKVQYATVGNLKKYASTYYVYDDLGNLVVVVPPEAVKQIVGN